MTYVYDFTEGDKDQKDLLGGKGANLAEMTNLGLPVPPGFTISTRGVPRLPRGRRRARRPRRRDRRAPAAARGGDGPPARRRPATRCWSASGPVPKVSMPGMMETVLNVGLNDESVRGLAEQSHDERFAMDSYRRLLQMFGATVLGIDSEVFSRALDRLKKDRGTESDTDLGVDDLRELVETFKQAIARARRPRLPAGPARAARPGDARRLRLVEHRARRPLPPPGAHRGGPRHGGQRAGDGLRQPRRRLGLRRRLHPRPGVRQPGRVRRLPAERAGRGRRRRHPQHRVAGRHGSRSTETSHDELLDDHGRRSRSTTATCATSSSPSSAASSGCSRPGSASAPRRRRSGSAGT